MTDRAVTDDERAGRVLTALLTMQRQSWEQGVTAQAALDLGRDDLTVLLADAAVTRQHADGRLADVSGEEGAVNGAACGEAVRLAATGTGDPRYATALDAQLDWLLDRAPRASDGTLFHLLGSRQVWADTVYMVVPLLALTGHPERAAAQVRGHRARLHDPRSGLYAARWDEERGVLTHPEHWGTGNGWVLAGISRALRLCGGWPPGVRAELAAHAHEVLDACLAHRGRDGLFTDVLDDPATFSEANAAQMVAYAALTGVADGWLSPSYAEVGADLLAAAARRVDARGLVTGVSGHRTSPDPAPRPRPRRSTCWPTPPCAGWPAAARGATGGGEPGGTVRPGGCPAATVTLVCHDAQRAGHPQETTCGEQENRMRALRLPAWKSEPELVEIDQPVPGPGEVVVRIGGAGACHSDLHLMHDFEAGAVPWNPPFTLGHENAGWVHALGDGVTGLEVGQPVAVYGPWGCGTCERCRVGVDPYCENPAGAPVPGGGGGLGLDGGMAEYELVPDARHVVPLPEGLDPVDAAPLTDAGLTPYHAVRRSWHKLAPGSTAVVIGVGGLGHVGVQILKTTTAARVIAVDTREEALALATECGADLALPSGAGTAEEIRRATGGRGADVVLDCVGTDTTLRLGVAAARTVGDLTIVGLGGGTLPVSFFGVPYELSVQTTYWGSRPELAEVLDLGARGLVRPTTTTFALEEAPAAYRQMRDGTLRGRAVVVP
ncbi:D-arabinose 1-dehydrogenase, Zn-dependent alcohol dehydrogenase family [Micromonospora nigra]|uniref:alcohol dehydrogenase n=1 Tax=Micromonospora nigra TaxID=145857 RepID=A0A1C6SSK0_9ACTN|nr:alcohol dehydrogenase catalytic domain-containing protein [Micromonospora nigra]SCL32470.1 D-arabinose 1-dehydrogenase, Zn-dependent alcohol dehydrogenase family [Micromonospora nigra]